MLRALASMLLLCIMSSSGQILNSPHSAAAFPGDWLQFRGDRKLTGRSRLVGSIAPPTVGTVSLGVPRRDTLPTVSFSSATVNIFTANANNGVPQADVSMRGVRTPDGFTVPTLAFWFLHPSGTNRVQLLFPAGDPDNQNIEGLPGLFIVDTSARTVSVPDLSSVPAPLLRLLFAVAANLGSIFKNATQVNVAPPPAGLPAWTVADAITSATSFADLLFQPSPALWSQFIGARQTSIAFQASPGPATINLSAADANAGTLAANSTWGVGPATYPGILNLNGVPIGFPIDDGSKIGKFIAGSNTYQMISFDSCLLRGTACLAYGHLSQWQNGGWVQQWQTQGILNMNVPQTIVGDFDGDGQLEFAVQPFLNIDIFDLASGALKTSARFTPDNVLTGRGYGWLGAYDLNGDGTQEIVNLGTFENYIAVMGWQNGQLVKLWDHTIEVVHYSSQTIHSTIAYPVQDIDGDGRLDIVTSIYNETGDGQWHVVARDGMTGNVLLDLPGRFLVGMTDVNGDGASEMFTIASSGQLSPAYGQVDVVTFAGRSLTTLLELNGVGWATQQVQSLPLNINTFDQLTNLIAGPITNGGLPVFFTKQLVDAISGTVQLTAWQWSNGSLTKLGMVTGPNLQALATRPADPGSPGFLVTAAVDGNTGTNIIANGFGGTIVQSGLIPAPLSSAVVGHLRPGDPPTVIVQNALQELVAFRPSSATGGATVVWKRPGRGGKTSNPDSTGQDGYAGPLLASLTGDGTLQTVAATSGPAGEAQVIAIQPDGSTLWTRDFGQFPGDPLGSGPLTGLSLSYAGRFRSPDREDVLASTQRATNPELNLLDGSTGELVWNDKNGSTPGTMTPPMQDGPGGAWLAVYDWNQDGLDEIVSTFSATYWVKDGTDKNLIDRNFGPLAGPAAVGGEVFPVGQNFQAFDGEPVTADLMNNGTDTILFGGSSFLLGAMSPQGNGLWQGAPQSGTPGRLQGIADLDGDGTLSLVSAGEGGPSGPSTLKVYRSSTGEQLWSIPLPGCGVFASGGAPNSSSAPTPVTTGDINGDGRDEAVFACGTKIYVVGADPGNRSGRILWTLDLGSNLDTPILADAEGNGRLEIVVVAANGYIYGIGSQPSTAPSAANAPAIAANGVMDGAAFLPGKLAPGGWFTIKGTNLSDGKYQAAAVPLPQQLGGTVVTVNGQIARLSYVDTSQINAEMPPDMPLGAASIAVTTKAGTSKSATVQIVPAMAEIFQYGANRAVAQNAPDYSLNGPGNAIPAGESLVVYFTGGGLVNGDRRTGVPAPLTTVMQTILPTTATIGDQPAQVAFSGLAPGWVGLYQVNITVPATLSPGDYPVVISIGGVTSTPALISVK